MKGHYYGAVILCLWAACPTLQVAAAENEEKEPAILTSKPIKAAPGDDELRKLLIARYNVTVAEIGAEYKAFQAGRGTLDTFMDTAGRLVHSGLELSENPTEQIALLEQYLELAKRAEKIQQARFDAATIPAQELERAHYFRLDIEIQLLKATRKAKTATPR